MNKISILLVDDDELILLGWQKELETECYDIRTASSGNEAVELATEAKPDIVITDLVMPGMNGVEVCTRIKDIHPDTEVVLVSGEPLEVQDHLMKFLSAGGTDEFLRKPIIDDELRTTVGKIVWRLK